MCRFDISLYIHLVDLDIAAIVFDLNFGHRFTLFFLYFDRLHTFLQYKKRTCKPYYKMLVLEKKAQR